MKFSCILPVYNTEKEYLDKCINSILIQSNQDFEILLIDDGSQEYTAELCDRYVQSDKRIRVIHQNNMGLPGARNTGIKQAEGDWLIHIDSDDWIGDSLLEKIDKTLQEQENLDILFWGYTSSNGKIERSYNLKNLSILDVDYQSIKVQVLRSILEGGNGFENVALNTTWGKAYRRNFVLDKTLFFDLELKRAQDVIYNLYAFSAANRIMYVDTTSYFYRLDNESLSRGYNEKTCDRLTKTARAAVTFLEKNPQYKEIEPAILAFCRRCFNIIVNMDFLNPKNPKQFCVRQAEFEQTLSKSPFVKAFAIENLPPINRLNNVAYRLISYKSLKSLSLFIRIRSFIRKNILHRI